MKPTHDLHIHTTLSSCCHDPLQVLENIIDKAVCNGLQTIGIADHLWDTQEIGECPNPWYRPQDFNYIMNIKEQLPIDTKGVKLLIGCETEFYGTLPAISPQNSAKLDFVLIPHSHTHMKNYVLPESYTTNEQIADFLCTSFEKLISFQRATAIAHPFFPCGYEKRLADIIACISDNRFGDLLVNCAATGTAIEINTGMFISAFSDKEPMLRMFQLAKECGCKFTFGTDSHRLSALDNIQLIDKATNLAGICEYDILEVS